MWPSDLPWQIDVLIADAIITVPILAVIMTRGVTYTKAYGATMFVWNVAILMLIGSGGSLTWQHSIYAALQLWATGLSIRNTLTRKVVPPSKHPGGEIAVGALFTVGLIYLLIGGNA
jgi:hypothetical protein